MYDPLFIGINDISPRKLFAKSFIIKCESYPERLWKTTGTIFLTL